MDALAGWLGSQWWIKTPRSALEKGCTGESKERK